MDQKRFTEKKLFWSILLWKKIAMSNGFIYFKIKTKVFEHKHENQLDYY